MTCEYEMPGHPGIHCQLPDGHSGPHAAGGPVPAEIGKMIDQAIEQHEAAAKKHLRASLVSAVAIVVWFLAAISNVIATSLGGDADWLTGLMLGLPLGALGLGGVMIVRARWPR